MNRRAFLSRLMAAPVVMALPAPVSRGLVTVIHPPSLTVPKLDQPIQAIITWTKTTAVGSRAWYTVPACYRPDAASGVLGADPRESNR